MLYLDQPRNRCLFMTVSIIATIGLIAVLIPGINLVGIMMAGATINILVYYLLPDRFSKPHRDGNPHRLLR